MKLIDVTGLRFGRLVVIKQGPVRPSKLGGSNWLCRCDCGKDTVVVGSALRRGTTRSCGCLLREWSSVMGSRPDLVKKRAALTATHGCKRVGMVTPEYKIWLGMKARCYRPRNKDYPNWGGKGIRVCDVWRNDFPAFLRDMGPRPSPFHTIDRLRSSEDYAPGNCRWATPQQQGGENRLGFKKITVQGKQFDKIADACRHFGVGATTVNERIKAGIPIDQAFAKGRLRSRRTRESYLRKSLRQSPSGPVNHL